MISPLPPSGWEARVYPLSRGPLLPQLQQVMADFRRTEGREPDGVALHPRLGAELEGLDLPLFTSPGVLGREVWFLVGALPATDGPKLRHPGGRPRREIPIALALSMKAEGLGVREISRRLRLPKSTLSRRLNGRG